MVRVKELLSWFDAQRRGVLVVREIRTALRKAKLVTVPDFEVAYIDQRIKLKAAFERYLSSTLSHTGFRAALGTNSAIRSAGLTSCFICNVLGVQAHCVVL